MNLRDRGYMGKILFVDLTEGKHRVEMLAPDLALKLIGGKGIGSYLLLRELEPGVDPLSPENVLIFGTGPLNGTLAPSSSKFVVLTKSPVSGGYLDSYCGGSFGNRLKRSGYDFLVIKGRLAEPGMVIIDEKEIRVGGAAELWGQKTGVSERIIKETTGRDYASVVIGPAGERLSPISGIMSDLRIAARGGLGAVMGSKKLKAITVRGNNEIQVHNREEFINNAWVAHRTLRMSAEVQRLTKYGSANILELINASGGLPTRNFQYGSFADSLELEGESWRDKNWVADIACNNCPIACAKVGEIQSGKYKKVLVDGPEYETIFSLGSNCGIDDQDTILAVNYLADEHGVDSISLGGIIGFTMELFEKGLISKEELDGVEANFGNAEAVLILGEKICTGEGIGRVLEKGVRGLSEAEYPAGSNFAMQVKGLEMPAYLPRAARGIALAYAISERGACHLHGAPIGELMGEADPLTYEGKPALVRSKQLDAAIIDSTIHCYFTDFGISLKEVYYMLKAATGFAYTGLEELEQIAERVITLTRLFNIREGFTRKEDILPVRCLEEAVPGGPAAGEKVDLERLLDEYYQVMSWDSEGRPTTELIKRLKMDDLIKQLTI